MFLVVSVETKHDQLKGVATSDHQFIIGLRCYVEDCGTSHRLICSLICSFSLHGLVFRLYLQVVC